MLRESSQPKSLREFIYEKFEAEVERVESRIVEAPHLGAWADVVEANRFTALIAFRGALKSIMAKAVVAKALYDHIDGAYDAIYYSATVALAREHLWRLKLYLQGLAAEWGWEDVTRGEAILKYRRPGAIFKCKPEGLDAAGRGQRANLLVIDDPVDPLKLASMVEIERSKEALQRKIMPMLKDKQSRILVAATPIVKGDIVDWVSQNSQFAVVKMSAVRDNGDPSWPQKYSNGELESLRLLVGQNAYRSEYLLEPLGMMDRFVPEDILMKCVGKTNANLGTASAV